MKAPCKNCISRHFKCHSECEKYIAFSEFRKNKAEARKEKIELWHEINKKRK